MPDAIIAFYYFNRNIAKLSVASHRVEELELTNIELVAEMEKLSQRGSEHLEFTSRLAEKNGCLQSDNLQLSAQVCHAMESDQKPVPQMNYCA
jgi:hypothetical protein